MYPPQCHHYGMTSDKSMPTFVVILDNDQPVILNLNHITTIRNVRGGTATLEMSSGTSIALHGGAAVGMLIELLMPHAVTLSGDPIEATTKS